ncbi:MAG: ABC transporter substrate-binding protein [Clostridiales bacterium]|nr:ABC transporter substrate-binding protein [Clostridiales bacterium]
MLVAAVFAGCSGSEETAKVYKVGICQLVEHDALDLATEGFQQALIDKLGEENVSFDLQNAANDSSTCATIVNGFVADGVDLIMANATPALQAAQAATDTIPIVGTSVTDYATALEISDWTGTTGTNITGTADLAPLAEQAAMIQELFPDAEQVGLIYCSGEPNSAYQISVIESELTELGIAYKEFAFSDSNDIASVTTSACSECDVLYIPTDNTAASCTETINNIAEPAGVPIVAGEEGICTGCGVATLSISYYNIGYIAGEMAADILQNGTDPGTVEIQYDTEPVKEYDADRCEALGITVPDGYVAIATEEE